MVEQLAPSEKHHDAQIGLDGLVKVGKATFTGPSSHIPLPHQLSQDRHKITTFIPIVFTTFTVSISTKSVPLTFTGHGAV